MQTSHTRSQQVLQNQALVMGHLMRLGKVTFFFSSTLKATSISGRQISLNSLPIVNILDLDIKAFLW